MRGVYLIHFDTPLKHARHYMGYAADIDKRLDAHRAGQGARLLEVLKEQGITWQLARTWKDATRTDERRLKNRKEGPRLCPICKAAPQAARAAQPSPDELAGLLAYISEREEIEEGRL